MLKNSFDPSFFKLVKLNRPIGITKLIENNRIPVTFNQLMKTTAKFSYIFIFDENSIEIPMLISFCRYFEIKLCKLSQEDVNEVKKIIKHARMVCIPCSVDGVQQAVEATGISEAMCNIKIC